jgi:signal transduction histidine kinase
MRLPKLNLRLRIAAVLATVCIAAVAALGTTLYMASKDMEQELVEQLVTEELEALIERARGDAPHVFTGGPNFQYYVLSWPAQREELPAALRNLGVGHHTVGVGPEEVHVAIRDAGARRYVVAYDAGPHEIREARFRNLLLFSLLTAAAVAVVLGYSLAGVLTRQLNDLASRVASLAPHEPHPPLERADHDDEVAALAHALDEYHTRMIDMMRREQEFSANASHELRTPLTAIRTSCELLAADEALSAKSNARVEMIDNAARQMTERIESLLLLARQRPPESLENVALRHCVDDAASPYKDEMNRKGLAFEVRIADDAVLQLDRKALQLVLANLIKNAVVYTERGYVRVSYEGQRLTVSDSGPGIAPQHREQVFERYYRADRKPEGLGLGLAIVRRICEDLGWKIEVQSNPGAGSTFSVVFS